MIRRLRMTVAHLKKQMDRRFTRLRREMNARFTAVDQRFMSVEQRLDAVDQRFDAVDRRFDAMDARFERSDLKFAVLERHLISLGEKFDSVAKTLNGNVAHLFRVAHEHEDRITDLEAAE